MPFWDRWFNRQTSTALAWPVDRTQFALESRRQEAGDTFVAERARVRRENESISLPFGMGGLDQDEFLYRRLTGQVKQQRRDLSPLGQDRMLELAYYLWEQNALAKRLVTLMADLILGEGVQVQATDTRNQAVITQTWNHRVSQLAQRIRPFYNSLSVNGELIFPVATNPISGIPVLGFIDPYQVADVIPDPNNVLIPDVMVLKSDSGQAAGQRLRIVRENPETGRLEGEVFFFRINNLPNGMRGRSDLSAIADWLDLYDSYMFGEVERLNLLSSFVYDHKIEGGTPETIAARAAQLPKFKPGLVFSHNEKETLEAVSPDLKANDRSEVSKMLRVHIAGTMGYPVSYLGDVDSNRATIEGQNDISLKTPAARQKEFGGMLIELVRYALENAQGANPALFRDVDNAFEVVMPEISTKDISRVGTVIASVVSGMDMAIANKTISRRAAVVVQAAIIAHLGVKLDPQEVMDEADKDAEDQQQQADQRQADLAARGIQQNPPVPGRPDLQQQQKQQPQPAAVA